MADLQRKMMIDWLVSDQFPVRFPVGKVIGRTGLSSDVDRFAEALAYRAELEALDDEALKSRYEAQALPKFKAIEEAHPFNQPGAKPDYAHWAKMAYWTTDEGIALLLGRSPHFLEWEKVKNVASPVIWQFAKIRETAKRAVHFKTLNANERPGSFIAWAKRFDLPLPAELEAQVALYGHFIGDWYTNYQALQELYQALQKNYEVLKDQGQENHRKALEALEDVGTKWRGMYEELRKASGDNYERAMGIIKARDAKIDELKAEIERLKNAALASPSIVDKPLGQREGDSLRKLIIGMAVVGYKYDPKAARSPVIPEIADDLNGLGLQLSVDTVRKHLSDASALLPPENAPERRKT